jgi:hypothetical protein
LISASPTLATRIREERPRVDDLDLVVLPLHLEGREVETEPPAGPAALESDLVVVEEVRLVVGRQTVVGRTTLRPPARKPSE